ncbi:MAG: cupin domain-containing protein [Candidatus Marinimicrobia bacterium]|nr:cupin domain-containing protein [Candidatus Neomarinimicrobiota bacterium]
MKKYRIIILMIAVMMVAFMNCRQQQTSETSSDPQSMKYIFNIENFKRYQFPTHINDLIIDREKSQFSEVFMVVLEPEKAPPLHKHDDTEQIFIMMEGTGTLTIGKDETKSTVKPGDIVRIPVCTWHSIRADRGETVRYLCIDCFGERPAVEPTWDHHVRVMCKTNGWNYDEVVTEK